GWFFLMACEMFVLGKRDFRLPGLGSFLETAANHGDTRAILWGVAAMIAVVVLLDQLAWRPIILWADKFKFEQVESSGAAHPALTFLRVNSALLLSALWTVPAGVAIGFSPRLARIAQPLVQIAASVPATALFPVILLFFLRLRGGMELAAMLLMLLGTQWYILFNVIAGALAIPTDLKEAAQVFHFGSWDRWRFLILPGIFPYLDRKSVV